jgi:hypothetical protein
MAEFNKTLQGVVRITEQGNYYFSLPTNPTPETPNALSNKVLEDVYIIIESINLELPNAVNIYLPKISLFNGNWNAKIHLLNKNILIGIGSAPILYSYIDPMIELNSDWLLYLGTSQIQLNSYSLLQITDDNYWGLISVG